MDRCGTALCVSGVGGANDQYARRKIGREDACPNDQASPRLEHRLHELGLKWTVWGQETRCSVTYNDGWRTIVGDWKNILTLESRNE